MSTFSNFHESKIYYWTLKLLHRKNTNSKGIFIGQIDYTNNYINEMLIITIILWCIVTIEKKLKKLGSIGAKKSVSSPITSGSKNSSYTPGHWIIHKLNCMYRYRCPQDFIVSTGFHSSSTVVTGIWWRASHSVTIN